jgi:hypothetical protein
MSQLRKREYDPETGAAITIMDIIQNNIRFRLKVERRMAAPFIELPIEGFIKNCTPPTFNDYSSNFVTKTCF